MTEEQIIEKRNSVVSKLNTTIGHLKTLMPEEFYFGSFIRKFDVEKKCGTICCIAGWYPRFYGDETRLFWNPIMNEMGVKGVEFNEVNYYENILTHIYNSLSEFHGINHEVITYLFNPVHTDKEIKTKTSKIQRNLVPSSSLEKVIEAWQNVSDLFTAGELDEHLI